MRLNNIKKCFWFRAFCSRNNLNNSAIWLTIWIISISTHHTRMELRYLRQRRCTARIDHDARIREIHPPTTHLTDYEDIYFSSSILFDIPEYSSSSGIFSGPPSYPDSLTIFFSEFGRSTSHKVHARYSYYSRMRRHLLFSDHTIIYSHDPSIYLSLHKYLVKIFYRIISWIPRKSIHGYWWLKKLIAWTEYHFISDSFRKIVAIDSRSPCIRDRSSIWPSISSRKSYAKTIESIEKISAFFCDK